MVAPVRPLKQLTLAATLGVALMASGCGFDGVELHGSMFDYMGISTGATAKKGEPRLAERPGIVVPPKLDRLPPPGSEQADAQPQEAWPDDPDQRRVAEARDLDRRHDEFCRDALWRAKARGQALYEIKGPKGPCSPSILKSIQTQ